MGVGVGIGDSFIAGGGDVTRVGGDGCTIVTVDDNVGKGMFVGIWILVTAGATVGKVGIGAQDTMNVPVAQIIMIE